MPQIDKRNELLIRVYLVLLGFLVFAVMIGWRIIKISVIEGDKWIAKKEQRYMEWRPVRTQRGSIYADDGLSLLATSVEFFEIRMDPYAPSKEDFYGNIEGLCEGLARFPGVKSASEWRSMIEGARVDYIEKKKGGTRNLLIAKEVDHLGLEELEKLPLFNLGQNRGGMIKKKKYVREKPYQSFASRTIGVHRDKNQVGLENSFDHWLRGEEKKMKMKFIPPDLWVSVYDPTDYQIIKGANIITTINVPMQDVVHNELEKGIREHQAIGGTAILMEVATGRIKAISNLTLGRDGSIGEYENYAVARRSEPGSTFKAASVLAILEDGLADGTTIVDFGGGKKNFYGLWMHDSGKHGISKSDLKEAFEISSNIGIASAMDEAYNKPKKWSMFAERLRKFGFDQVTGIELEGEPKPFLKDPVRNKSEWYNTTIPWMSHGYELSTTPLQILNFYNAVANNGVMMKPQLVQEIRKDEEIMKQFRPRSKGRIAKEKNIAELQSMLEGVVIRGTGKELKSSRYDFAGKTGTTKVDYNTEDKSYNASFAGYWPTQNPKYSMIVVVYGLKGSIYYGNLVAGPIFRRIMDWNYAIDKNLALVEEEKSSTIAKYSGEIHGFNEDYEEIFTLVDVPYTGAGRWIIGDSNEQGSILNDRAKISVDVIPDVSGMGLRDAVYVLENLGMKVKIDGYGRVSRQNPKAGLPIDNQEIILHLN